MPHPIRLLILLAATGLIACGSDRNAPAESSQPTDRPAASVSAGQTEIDWASRPIVLSSDALHDIAMPEPGRARVEIYGEVFESELMADCSAPTEPPPMVNDWDDHRFNVSFQIQMGDSYSNVSVLRAVKPESYGERRSGPVEVENLAIRTLAFGGQTEDLRGYSLNRTRPERAPRISFSQDHLEYAQSLDEVPGIKVHPDGRRATFVGRLGRGQQNEDSEHPDEVDVRIAIHCGPV